LIWAFILKCLFFKFYIRLKTQGTFDDLYKKYPRLIIISNHTSHLDAVSIAASIPLKYWNDLFIAAAKDYFFSNPVFTFFSQHCLGAIPIDRKEKKSEAVRLVLTLLNQLERMWLIMFPEGTRSRDGRIHDFKKGVSIFSEKTNTPVLFIYIKGGAKLWPKGHIFAKPGELEIYVGPVQPPAPISVMYGNFKKWVETIEPGQFAEEGIQDVTN
jgi:1-acyl-sn-glycerol-3-phosphate acyltransferase